MTQQLYDQVEEALGLLNAQLQLIGLVEPITRGLPAPDEQRVEGAVIRLAWFREGVQLYLQTPPATPLRIWDDNANRWREVDTADEARGVLKEYLTR